MLFPLLFLGLLELGLRLAGYGYPTSFFLHAKDNGRVMLADNPRFGWRFFPPAIARTPRPLYLAAKKPPNTVRIFVFGESAAFGDPSPAFGLPRVLEVLLRNRYPGVNFEVINAAMTAINSHVILPIAKECAREEGDIWVLYMGNNEVVGPYGGGTAFGPQAPSLAFVRASIGAKASRIGQLLAGIREVLSNKKSGPPSSLSLELFLNYKLKLTDPRMEKVYAHFARNLSDILETGTRAGAQVVVSTVASNLKDCAPFASMHRPELTEAETSEWDRFYQAGIKAEQEGKFAEVLKAYSEAARIDDQWADLQFRQARLLLQLSDFAAALHHFTLARDYDALRFRADTRINEILRQTCSNRLSEGIAFLDGNDVLAQRSPHEIPGRELLYEHVHLNFTGNYWLARAIAENIANVLKPAALTNKVPATGDWLPEEECAAQLGLNDWDRCETLGILRRRLESAPFTLQLNQPEQHDLIQKELAQCISKLAAQSLTASVQRCEQALASNPKDWVLHQKLAELLSQSPDKAQQVRGIGEFRQVIAMMPRYPVAHYQLGELLDRAGHAAEAENQLRVSLELSGNNDPNALNALGHALAGQNRFAEAVEQYERALRLKPNFPEALANLGVALNRLGKKAEARARLEEATRLAPGNIEAAVNLGQLLNENGEVSAAIKHYTQMLDQNPSDAVAHFNLGRCYEFLGRLAEAQEQYASALQFQPDYADAHTHLGMQLARSGKELEAMDHFRAVVRLQPNSGLAHKNLGIALARQKNFTDAGKEFEEALRLDPGDAESQKFLQAARRSHPVAK